MRAPIAPSAVWRKHGHKAVFYQGLVIWLTPRQYEKVRVLDEGKHILDATEEQIEAQDRWYESARADREREDAEFKRLFRSMA